MHHHAHLGIVSPTRRKNECPTKKKMSYSESDKGESSEFTFLRSHVSFDFVFANLNLTARTRYTHLPVLGSSRVNVLALALVCFAVPRQISRQH